MTIKINKSQPVEQVKLKVLDVTKVRKGWKTKISVKTMIKNLIKNYPRIVGFIIVALFLVFDYFISHWFIEDIAKVKAAVSWAKVICMIIAPFVVLLGLIGLMLLYDMCEAIGKWVAKCMDEGW